jgi:hypothetical protein
VSYSTSTVASLLREKGSLLEYVKATVTAEQLARGVDLLRTSCNEITLLAGKTVEDQVWQSARFFCEDPSVVVSLSVGPDIVGPFRVGEERQRLAGMRLITAGSTVRAPARSGSRSTYTSARAVLEIFGWSISSEMLPSVKEAIRLIEAS